MERLVLQDDLLPPESGLDRITREVSDRVIKIKEGMVIDLMLRGVRLSEMMWVTDPSKKEWLYAPGYKLPAPEYRFEGNSVRIDYVELNPQP